MAKTTKKNPKAAKKSQTLSDREKRFCEEYIIDLNGTQALLRVSNRMTRQSASTESSRLLKLDRIQKRLSELRAEQSKRTAVTADRVIAELARVAFFDLGSAYNDEGALLDVPEMPEDVRRALQGIKIFEEFGENKKKIGETRELKPADKVRALELLGKHFKLFTDKHEHAGKLSLEDLIAGAGDAEEE